MYLITVMDNDLQRVLLKAQTANRAVARNVALLAEENEIVVEVMVEAKPRLVKFKGVGKAVTPAEPAETPTPNPTKKKGRK